MHEIDFLRQAGDIIRQIGGSALMLDIGANVDQHRLALQSNVEQIIAFEPNPATATRFRPNIQRNAIRNIELHEVTLGDSDEIAMLGSGLEANDGSRSLNWSIDQSADISAQVRTAGRYLDEIIPDDTSVALLKIDVEGHEARVLSSLSHRSAHDRPMILFELFGKDVNGGVTSEAQLLATFYSNHPLYGLDRGGDGSLSKFDWQRHEEAICIPAELTLQIENAFISKESSY